MNTVKPLEAGSLYRRCDPSQFPFKDTGDLEHCDDIVGQARAVEAVHFGISIQQEGYNLFALGPNGTGKYSAVHRFLEQKAAEKQIPSDWCYVHNFEQPHLPAALSLPAGRGAVLSLDIDNLIEELLTVIPAAFESENYQNQKQAILDEVQHKQEDEFEALAAKAIEQNIALIRTPGGLAFAPVKDGSTMSPDEFKELPDEEKEKIQTTIAERQEELQRIIRQLPQYNREGRDKIKKLDQEVVTFAVAPLINELSKKNSDLPHVVTYLQMVQKDISEHIEVFQGSPSSQAVLIAALAGGQEDSSGGQPAAHSALLNRYKINVLVDHSQTKGAPIIFEDHPSHQNLLGRVEHISQMGALLTDFTLIKPGALHKANGGYLILEARNLLLQPYAWESLKRALRAKKINIESLGQSLSLISTISLEPEPIPLDVKIVLLGERLLYYLLYQYDPEFGELFKVAADFEDQMSRSPENMQAYARLLGTLIRKNELRHCTPEGVARVLEYSSRLVGDAEKLSTHMQSVTDLLREASHWAGEEGHPLIEAADVQRAIEAQVYRSSRVRERLQEAIIRQTLLIDTSGEKVGQINGLAVLQMGNFMFGHPSRITAQVRMGKGEVIDIERQVEMGGPIHSKGVLILTGFLGGRYGAEQPLSISASLVFEQSYSGVEGDSASSAELYALLSALSGAPVKQAFAVTGSVNQHGEVQAIGGVNEKIEGFFDICQTRGLTGDQGVLIPAANVKNLMLNQPVIDAISQGQFNVYPVRTIDEGIELLTGIPAGEKDEQGRYPEGTINQRVAARLTALVEKQKELQRPPVGGESHA